MATDGNRSSGLPKPWPSCSRGIGRAGHFNGQKATELVRLAPAGIGNQVRSLAHAAGAKRLALIDQSATGSIGHMPAEPAEQGPEGGLGRACSKCDGPINKRVPQAVFLMLRTSAGRKSGREEVLGSRLELA